jgi:hypothetical protein
MMILSLEKDQRKKLILAALTLCLLLTITVGLPAFLINRGMIAWAFFWLLMCSLATA